MTVTELYNKLGEEMAQGHGDLEVIANCAFTIRDNEHYDEFYLTHLNKVYYQSGDMELAFSDEEE